MHQPLCLLDFDGVLHPFGRYDFPGNDRLATDHDLFVWRPVLARLLHGHPAWGIVITSSWRFSWSASRLAECLGPELEPRFVGVAGPEREGLTKVDYLHEAVAEYQPSAWFALDDDSTVEAAQADEPRFIWCPPGRGIADIDVGRRVTTFLEQFP